MEPVRAVGLTNAVRIAAGAAGSYAIGADEVAYEWGSGTSTRPFQPYPVLRPTPLYGVDRVYDLAAGQSHVVAAVR